tara:strand:- start:1217 stop:1426 length:210 start_codon:yes stop_codon:yes gene_type:complete
MKGEIPMSCGDEYDDLVRHRWCYRLPRTTKDSKRHGVTSRRYRKKIRQAEKELCYDEITSYDSTTTEGY